jgi:hypothetical protein
LCGMSLNSISLWQVKYNEFIAEEVGVREGRLLEAETGEVLGLHRGFWFYTIGQRQGLGLPNGPWYVYFNVVWVLFFHILVGKFLTNQIDILRVMISE